jgi:hypothetical protein
VVERLSARRGIASVLCVSALLGAVAFANPPTAQEAMKEVGVALGWRLRPPALEEQCRSLDPAGAGARATALRSWQTKNARLIQSIDERLEELAPALGAAVGQQDLLPLVRGHIKEMVLEQMFENKSAEQTTAICQQLVDPASVLWTNNGMPFVQESLAALYDWKVAQSAR